MKKPFHIVSGFLGSGKTTFLKRVIDSFPEELKLGIIQNEFAHSGIDGEELRSSGKEFKLLEINKGSVFCVCLLAGFSRSLEKFVDEHQPDVLVLEASGLSDTTSVAEILSSGKLAEKIFLATNWCIVDTFNFSRSGMMRQRVEHQIRMADVILLNKTDLTEGIDTVEQQVKKVNPFARIVRTVQCNTAIDFGNSALTKYYPVQVKPLERPEINSMVIKSGKSTTFEHAMEFLREWASRAYRLKGYINLKNGKTLAVQCVYDSVNFMEVDGKHYPTELIALTDRFTLREWNAAFRSIT